MSKTATDTATNELIRHAIAAWGYLFRARKFRLWI